MGDLNNVAWGHIDRLMTEKRISKADLKLLVHRNKNTYTNWFSDPRPALKLDDVAEIAAALEVDPSELLREPAPTRATVEQIELRFDGTSRCAALELECVRGGVVLRPPRPSSN